MILVGTGGDRVCTVESYNWFCLWFFEIPQSHSGPLLLSSLHNWAILAL
ncbi:hypothetical protein Lalb_Chr11g0071791 [Lupinus albus]|uniref:Uncharacterized protein n=1 Tax=Lupinus albus TaxID=3870 RepID=A0A6A4PSP5_LUPAL|nr:hypothetical protein Lalb_Chr11g0071791 [Lupinus albus]